MVIAPSAAQAAAAIQKGIARAKAAGSTEAIVKFKNAASLSAAVLKQIAATVNEVGMSALIHADAVVDGKIVARMHIDPSKTTLKKNLVLGVTVDNEKLEVPLAKQLGHSLTIVTLAQKGSLGMSVRLAVKLDLSMLKSKNLHFYSYDEKNSKTTLLEDVKYTVNKKGYVFFNTSVGGNIIITDRPITSK